MAGELIKKKLKKKLAIISYYIECVTWSLLNIDQVKSCNEVEQKCQVNDRVKRLKSNQLLVRINKMRKKMGQNKCR